MDSRQRARGEIQAAIEDQIACETRIRETFRNTLARAKASRPARDDTPLGRLRRLARASGWQEAEKEAGEPGVLAGWHKVGGVR